VLSKRVSIGLFFAGFAAILAIGHAPFLSLPFFWDELGQFVPASLDIFQHGDWVPKTTLPNVHPPGVMAYLALTWRVFGYSIPATRLAMLFMGSFGVLFTFLLSIRLSRNVPGAPAFAAAAFLLVTPMFYTQSMMAELDMPAMVFTALALLLFLDNKIIACVAACTALVLMKETGVSTPFVLALWLMFREKRVRESLYFLAPAIALGIWLMVLHRATGHWLGNEEFAKYNVSDSLQLGHIFGSLWRRGYFLFVADGLWIGALVLFAGWRSLRGRDWNLAFLVAGAQILLVSVLGGASLDRYTLPAFPVLYAAMAAAGSTLPVSWRWITRISMAGALLIGLWWNPPYPFSFENNLAMTDFVDLQQSAALYLDEHASKELVASAWPFTDELRRPEFGYVHRPIEVRQIEDFRIESLLQLQHNRPDVLVVYCRVWALDGGALNIAWLRNYLDRVWGIHRQATPEQIREALGFVPVIRWDRRGQWIEIYLPETSFAGMAGRRLLAADER
jgi:4-amino-4-deoxy-L-arabinose transferase-like glycosyltransferase